MAAGACALTWSSYSVLNRRFGSVPTEAVAGFCLAPLTPAVAIACGLIVGGGLIASGVIGHRRATSTR